MTTLRPKNQLEVENVSLDLSGRRILDNISLSVSAGDFLGIIGPNGGGKTTLLRLLLGVLQPSTGRVHWADEKSARPPRIGYVPQRGYVDRSYPLAASEIVKQGASGAWPLFGSNRRDVALRADQLLNELGLEAQAGTSYVHLSGGVTLQPSEVVLGGNGGSFPVARYCSMA